MNTTETRMRVRVRPLKNVPPEQRKAVSKQNCLSVPHMGEGIDRAASHYDLRQASVGKAWEREFHMGHAILTRCGDEDTRCVYVDYVPEARERGEDELDTAGLVAKAK